MAAGLISSLGRPGGNVTGLSLQTTDLAGKRLQLARELVAGARRIGLLAEGFRGPAHGTTALLVAETRAAAAALGITLVVRELGGATNWAKPWRGSSGSAPRRWWSRSAR